MYPGRPTAARPSPTRRTGTARSSRSSAIPTAWPARGRGRHHGRDPSGGEPPMGDVVKAPLDPAALGAALRPFGLSRTLPAQAYTDPAVLAWERRHLFAGSWT